MHEPEAHETPTGPEPRPDAPEAVSGDVRGLARDVSALVATVDQHSAEIDAIDTVVVLLAFAFGALAGIVYLHTRQLNGLTDALPG